MNIQYVTQLHYLQICYKRNKTLFSAQISFYSCSEIRNVWGKKKGKHQHKPSQNEESKMIKSIPDRERKNYTKTPRNKPVHLLHSLLTPGQGACWEKCSGLAYSKYLSTLQAYSQVQYSPVISSQAFIQPITWCSMETAIIRINHHIIKLSLPKHTADNFN